MINFAIILEIRVAVWYNYQNYDLKGGRYTNELV